MKTIELKGSVRQELGKKATKKVRNSESVPCVLYGEGEPIHFSGNEKEFGQVIFTPNTYQVNLNIDGTVYPSIVKDLQFHPVSDRVLHMDFQKVAADKPVIVSIPVQLEGFAKGVQQGGKLKMEMRRVRVQGLIANLPDQLVVDVTEIEAGQTIKVRDLSFENFTIHESKNAVIASVKSTRASKSATEGSPS